MLATLMLELMKKNRQTQVMQILIRGKKSILLSVLLVVAVGESGRSMHMRISAVSLYI